MFLLPPGQFEAPHRAPLPLGGDLWVARGTGTTRNPARFNFWALNFELPEVKPCLLYCASNSKLSKMEYRSFCRPSLPEYLHLPCHQHAPVLYHAKHTRDTESWSHLAIPAALTKLNFSLCHGSGMVPFMMQLHRRFRPNKAAKSRAASLIAFGKPTSGFSLDCFGVLTSRGSGFWVEG